MLGIYCVSCSDRRDRKAYRTLEELRPHAGKAGTVLTNGSGLLAARLVTPDYRRESSSFQADSANWLLVDGIALSDKGSRALTAEELYRRLCSKGPEALHALNGEFLLLASLGNDVWLISDRMGQRQHSLSRAEGMTAFAPSPGMALELAGIAPAIDQDALLTFLLSNKLRLGEQTIWKDCEAMPAASEYRISAAGSLSHRQYWGLAYSPDHDITLEEAAEEAARIFREAVEARLPSGARVGMTLTGGLDSRLMAGAVPLAVRGGITCSTMGMAGCDEIEIAKAVAKRAGYSHREVHLEAETAFFPANAGYLDGEEIDLVIQNCWKPFLEQNDDRDLLLHGLDLDVTLGGIYLTPELEEVSSFDHLTDYALRHALSSSLGELANLFSEDVMVDGTDAIRTRISRMLDAAREDSLLNTYDHFILQNSMHRVILQRYRTIRRFVDTLTPMYDTHLIDLYLRLPPEMRAQHGVFKQVLLKICPDLARLPYQRTGLPPETPRRFWPAGQRLEGEREELLRQIARETEGKSHVPYMRYYTNVDEWLRFDPVWMRACDELLCSPRSVIRRQYLKASRVDEIIAEHRAHRRSHMKVIHIMMSAELFLRMADGADLNELFDRLNHV